MGLKMIDTIIIHCSATPNGRYHTAEDMHRWHSEKGWDGIGYHFVIRTDGKRDNGRPIYWTGAHAGSHNKNSIGICLIGTDEFTLDQESELLNLLDELKQEHPDAKVIGHNEISSKTCPGFDVQKWLNAELIGKVFRGFCD